MNFIKASVLLILIGLTAYANSVFHPFVHDDLIFIRFNPHIADLSNFFFIFPKAVSASGNLTIINPYYRPLIELLFKLEYRLFHFNAAGYHFFNVLIHIVNGILIFRLMSYLTERQVMSWCIAALFLIHPVQSEAVAAIAGISNLLYVLLFLSSFLFYLKATGPPVRKKYVFYVAALFSYLISLLIKEQAIVLPFLIILYEFCFKDKDRSRPVPTRFVGGFILVTAGYLFWRKFFLGTAVVPIFDYKGELFLRLLAIPRTLLMYLRVLFFPHDLHYYRSIDVLDPPGIALGLLIFILAGVFLWMRYLPKTQSRLLIFGMGWFLITIFPTLNIIPLIHEYSTIAAFEHFLYLPLAGLAIFVLVTVTHFIREFFKERTRMVNSVLLMVMVLTCLGLTVKQNTYWRGEIPLFERVVKHEKHFGRAHILLGKAYYAHREFDKAINEFQTAHKIMQGYLDKVVFPPARKFYLDFIKEIHFDLAHCFEAKGNHEKSLNQYHQALQIDPNDASLHNNIGLNYVRAKDLDKAIQHFQQAIALNPNDLSARGNLAVCYIEQGEKRQAERILREVLTIDSEYIPARRNLEKLLSVGAR